MAAQPLCHDAVRVCTVNMQARSHLQVLPALNFLFSTLFLAQKSESGLTNSSVCIVLDMVQALPVIEVLK